MPKYHFSVKRTREESIEVRVTADNVDAAERTLNREINKHGSFYSDSVVPQQDGIRIIGTWDVVDESVDIDEYPDEDDEDDEDGS